MVKAIHQNHGHENYVIAEALMGKRSNIEVRKNVAVIVARPDNEPL